MEKGHLILNCQGAHLQHSGGVGRYAVNLTSGLNSLDSLPFTYEIRDFNKHPESSMAAQRPLIYRASKKIAKAVLPSHALQFVKNQMTRHPVSGSALNHSPLPNGLTLVHEISNYRYFPQVGRLISRPNFRYMATFLDLQDFYFPDFFSDEELSARRVVYSFLKDYCHSFLAISEFTKKSMVEQLRIPAESITVTYLGSDIPLSENLPRTNGVHSPRQKYLIYPAKPWRHKNHPFLLMSVGRLQTAFRTSKARLLLTGGFSHDQKVEVTRICEKLGILDLVEVKGFLPDSEIKLLIREAHAMVFPSLFEGFGMPIVEAQAIGCPVISSNAASLKEICLDTAMTFDPTDPSQLDACLNTALSDDFDRRAWIEKGLKNAERFSWKNCITQTVTAYRKSLGNF